MTITPDQINFLQTGRDINGCELVDTRKVWSCTIGLSNSSRFISNGREFTAQEVCDLICSIELEENDIVCETEKEAAEYFEDLALELLSAHIKCPEDAADVLELIGLYLQGEDL